VGIGGRIVRGLPWWRFEPRQDWISPTRAPDGRTLLAAAAGVRDELRVYYLGYRTEFALHQLGPGSRWEAALIDPLTGAQWPVTEPVVADEDGRARAPLGPILQDWVLVLRRS
jgi:hypothetical protein